MREMGIALATAISAWINVFLLFFILHLKKNLILDIQLITNSLKIIFSVIIMISVCFFLDKVLFFNFNDITKLSKLMILILIIGSCKIVYLVMIFMLKVLTIEQLKGYIKNNASV